MSNKNVSTHPIREEDLSKVLEQGVGMVLNKSFSEPRVFNCKMGLILPALSYRNM